VLRVDNLTTYTCLEIWEPQPPGNVRASLGLYRVPIYIILPTKQSFYRHTTNKDMEMKSASFWDITQRMIISYRRFGADRLSVPKRRYGISVLSCIKSRKSPGGWSPKSFQALVRFILSTLLKLIASQCGCYVCRYLSRPSFCSQYPADPLFFTSTRILSLG